MKQVKVVLPAGKKELTDGISMGLAMKGYYVIGDYQEGSVTAKKVIGGPPLEKEFVPEIVGELHQAGCIVTIS